MAPARSKARDDPIRERSTSQEDHLVFTLRTAFDQCGCSLTLRLFRCGLVGAQFLQHEPSTLARHDLLRATALRVSWHREAPEEKEADR